MSASEEERLRRAIARGAGRDDIARLLRLVDQKAARATPDRILPAKVLEAKLATTVNGFTYLSLVLETESGEKLAGIVDERRAHRVLHAFQPNLTCPPTGERPPVPPEEFIGKSALVTIRDHHVTHGNGQRPTKILARAVSFAPLEERTHERR